MNANQETNVDENSREFRRGVEDGLDSEEAKHWQPGCEPSQELGDSETKEPVKELLHKEFDTPLFLKDTPDVQKGDAQDEKDKSAE